jgi:superfamily II DNA or RNA helicase
VRQFLPGASVGVIQQGRIESDADVVVGMVQSIAKRDYEEHVLSGFGLVVIDEAHHMAAPVFSRAMRKIHARYTLALSATPERRDGMDDLLRWSLGDIVFRVQRDAELVHVHSLLYECRRPAICLGRDGRPVLARMLNALAEDPARNRLIVQHIAHLARQGRKIIVMSDRVAQLHVLDQLLVEVLGGDGDGEGGGEGEEGDGGAVTRGFYTGKTPPAERQAAEHKQVIFTTYAMSREALDIPALDTLVMATPVGTVEQVVGRILRKHPDKQIPLVLDVVDPYSVFDCMRWKRRKYYAKQGYERQTATLGAGASGGGSAPTLQPVE